MHEKEFLEWFRNKMSPQFVQVGQQAVNMDLVSDIWLGDDKVSLYFPFVDGDEGQVVIRFKGPEYYAFMEWWKKKADVHVCYVEGE